MPNSREEPPNTTTTPSAIWMPPKVLAESATILKQLCSKHGLGIPYTQALAQTLPSPARWFQQVASAHPVSVSTSMIGESQEYTRRRAVVKT